MCIKHHHQPSTALCQIITFAAVFILLSAFFVDVVKCEITKNYRNGAQTISNQPAMTNFISDQGEISYPLVRALNKRNLNNGVHRHEGERTILPREYEAYIKNKKNSPSSKAVKIKHSSIIMNSKQLKELHAKLLANAINIDEYRHLQRMIFSYGKKK